MHIHRKAAIVTGVLFIVATASSLISFLGILDPLLSGSDYLMKIAENQNLAKTGVLFELVNNTAIVAISIVLFPVLRTYSMTLALAYIAARVFESVIITIGDISILSLVTLGQAFLVADAQQAVGLHINAEALMAIYQWTFLLGPGIVLCFTALILNFVLYQTKLVPVALSIWGLIGALLLFTGDILAVYGYDYVLLFAAPIALQEMVFAVWLIVRGFSTPTARPQVTGS